MKPVSTPRVPKVVATGLNLLLWSGFAHASLYTDAVQLPSASYDFVIIGGKLFHESFILGPLFK